MLHLHLAEVPRAMEHPNDQHIARCFADEAVLDVIIAMHRDANVWPSLGDQAVADVVIGKTLEVLRQFDDEGARLLRIVLGDPAADGT